jgi:phosphomannomutase
MEAGYNPDPSIFREYDIRGVVGKTLSADDAYLIARAFVVHCRRGRPTGFICVGRDGRLSSPELKEAVCQGICDSGFKVRDIGLGPTPMLYYAATTLDAAGGMMITGSHNPPDHNGFKFVLKGKPFFGEDIQSLREIIASGKFHTGHGKLSEIDVSDNYIEALLKGYGDAGPLNVAWDSGSGATGEIMTRLTDHLPGMHMLLNAKIDGTFPSHHPDPTVPDNLRQLIALVTKSGLDAGIAFDGDGDRVGVVDDEGEILWGDQLMMLYAAEVLAAKPGATIIADVKASGALFEEIERLGGKPLMWKTGHSLIKSKMAETKAPLAGEMSGHIFFADKYYGYDDGLYAAVRLLALLKRSGHKLSDLRKMLPKRVNTPEIRFPCDDVRKFDIIEEVRSRLEQDGAEFSGVDGVRVSTADGWWLLRASNTQPVLVARCEAQDNKGLTRLQGDLAKQLELSGVSLPHS